MTETIFENLSIPKSLNQYAFFFMKIRKWVHFVERKCSIYVKVKRQTF